MLELESTEAVTRRNRGEEEFQQVVREVAEKVM